MKPTKHFERTSNEYIILALSIVSVVSLFPFTIHRIVTEDWAIAFLDMGLMATSTTMFIYVFKTRKTEMPSLLLALLFMAGETTTVALKGPQQLVWAFPCTVGVYYLTTVPRGIAINIAAGVTMYSFAFNALDGIQRGAFAISFIATNVFTIVFAVRNKIQKQQLETLTLKDPLTGVNNRRAFENYLNDFDNQERPEDQDHSLILIDIDHFKSINDKHGHLEGDDALVRLVTLIQTQLHHEEKLYRIGGEEYVIAPIKMDLDTSFEFADRLRKIIEHSNINEKLGITVSIGVAACREGEPSREWVRRADQALYAAKNNGRNQTYKSV